MALSVSADAAAENRDDRPDVPVQQPETAEDLNVETKRKDDEPASRFVPSEKLRADDAISFPVDI